MSTELIIGMAGSGGDGVVSAGESIITALALDGYYALLTKSFGSQIRGGESSIRLRVSTGPIYSLGGTLDVAFALSWEDFLKFGAELPIDGRTTLVYDETLAINPLNQPPPGVSPVITPAPITALAKETAGTDRAKNIVVLGLLSGWFGLPDQRLLEGVRKKFAKKGADLVAANERAFATGLQYALAHPIPGGRRLEPGRGGDKLLTDGNDMTAAAAIFAGCQFFGGYPITPSSEVMHFLSRELWKYGGSVLQAEDEIAGVGACVGASFAGKKVLTATSGPGVSLKTEMLGLATIAELPLVCVNVQRGGPSTGLPTKGEQADLFQAIFSSHGDATRPVLAPTSVADTFAVTVEAFNIAEKYQTPVMILSDQEIAQRKEIVDPIDVSKIQLEERRRPTEKELENYLRFRITESGVSPISQPGMKGGNYLASGIEHTEIGAPTASGEVHGRMNEKRFRKLEPLKNRQDLFTRLGPPDAPLCLVAWGSIAGVAREALEIARRQGLNVKLLVPILLYPVAESVYQDFFASVRRGLVIEQSHQGQLYRVLRMYVNVPDGVEAFTKSGAIPFSPEEVVERLRDLSRALQGERETEPTLS